MEQKNEKKEINKNTKKKSNNSKKKKSTSTVNKKVKENKKIVENVKDEKKSVTKKKKTKKENVENLDKTNSFDIIIDDERMHDKESLDFSFIDNSRKKKKASKKIEILEDIDYEKLAREIDFPKKKNNIKEFFINFVMVIFAVVLGFLICFIWAKTTDYFVKIEEKVETKVIMDDNYVFVGDSIFQFYDLEKYYEDMPVINSGVSGHTTSDILSDMNDRVYKYNPSKVILLIGTNDLVSKDNDEIINNIFKIVKNIKKNRPYAEIFVQSIYPINDTMENSSANERKNDNIMYINEKVENFCKEYDVTYMNIYDLLVNDDGELDEEYTYDGLHLSDEGYEVVTKEVMKVLEK